MKANITVTKTSKTLRAVEIRFSDGDYTFYPRLTARRAEEIIDEMRRDQQYSDVEVVRK